MTISKNSIEIETQKKKILDYVKSIEDLQNKIKQKEAHISNLISDSDQLKKCKKEINIKQKTKRLSLN